MSRTSLLLFAIAPVQKYIEASRKTHDLYAGSKLLSDLSLAAVNTVKKAGGEVVFPFIPAAGDAPSIRFNSIPNRFVARLDTETAASIAKRAEAVVQEKYDSIARKAKEKIETVEFKENAQWNRLWDEQTRGYWEVYWVIVDLPADYNSDESYGNWYKKLEQTMGIRKTIKAFSPLEQIGAKCSLFESFSAVFPDSFKNAKSFTENYLAKRNPAGQFKKNELLSAQAVTKRLYSSGDPFPSTINIASASFLKKCIEIANKEEKFRTLILKYNLFTEVLSKILPDSGTSTNLPSLESSTTNPALTTFLQLNPEYLHKDSFTKLRCSDDIERNFEDRKKVDAKENLNTHWKNFEAARFELLKYLNYPPSKYYALFFFDGDKMGTWLSGEVLNAEKKPFKITPEKHSGISEALHGFALKTVPTCVETNHLGKLVFAGGDDVIGFADLSDVITIIKEIYSGYALALGAAVGYHASATGSCGVVIAHQSHSLQDVLAKAREAEHRAKNDLGRNAFSITLMKHSGETLTAGGKFTQTGAIIKPGDEIVFPLFKLFASFYECVQNGYISGKFIYTVDQELSPLIEPLKGCAGAVSDDTKKVFLNITKTILERQSNLSVRNSPASGVDAVSKKEISEKIRNFLSNFEEVTSSETPETLFAKQLRETIDLLKVVHFIAKRGIE